MTDPAADVAAALARADASYGPILNFTDWVPSVGGLDGWDEAKRQLVQQRAQVDPDVSTRLVTEALRGAAVDTGAIEGLYRTDAGFTWSIAVESISLAEAERQKGKAFRPNFEAQLAAFELVLDVATRATPVSEALVRRLHEVTCAGQPTYEVFTAVGLQEQALRLGEYKVHPNSPQLPDGSFHAYAPVLDVVAEMVRLVEQFRSTSFVEAHPVVQAAYAHHAFVHIHPFADGNGRVARLLASIWLLRAASIPLWVRSDDRDVYLASLRTADGGDRGPWVDFVGEASLQLLREASLALLGDQLESSASRRVTIRSARSSADRQLYRLLREVLGENVTSWEPNDARRLPLTGGLDFDGPGKVSVVSVTQDLARWIALGIDWSAGPESRFVLSSESVGPDPVGHVQAIRESFSERELVPAIRSSAKRRLEQVALALGRERSA